MLTKHMHIVNYSKLMKTIHPQTIYLYKGVLVYDPEYTMQV